MFSVFLSSMAFCIDDIAPLVLGWLLGKQQYLVGICSSCLLGRMKNFVALYAECGVTFE